MTPRGSGRGHALVIGGGIAGCAAALALVDAGVGVTLVERRREGAGATGAAAGLLSPQFETSEPSPLLPHLVRAREEYDRFAARLEESSGASLDLRRDGLLVVNRDAGEERRAERAVAWQEERGLRAELLSPAEARRRVPGLGDARSALWLPDEASVDVQALASALAPALRASGAVRRRGRVRAVRSRGGRIEGVDFGDGSTLEADRVVVACGAWAGRLDGLPRPLPVRPVRGQIVRLRGVPEPPRSVGDHLGRYVLPRADGSVVAGSTMEEAGFEERVSEEGIRGVVEAARRLLPDLGDASVTEVWAGLRPVTPDGLPILGPEPDVDGLVYAAGYGRNGILFGPYAGRLVADVVLGREPEADLSPFRADRF